MGRLVHELQTAFVVCFCSLLGRKWPENGSTSFKPRFSAKFLWTNGLIKHFGLNIVCLIVLWICILHSISKDEGARSPLSSLPFILIFRFLSLILFFVYLQSLFQFFFSLIYERQKQVSFQSGDYLTLFSKLFPFLMPMIPCTETPYICRILQGLGAINSAGHWHRSLSYRIRE